MHHATKHDPLTEKVLRVLRHHQGPLRLLELGASSRGEPQRTGAFVLIASGSGTGLVSIGLARALRGLTENVHTTITATDLGRCPIRCSQARACFCADSPQIPPSVSWWRTLH